MNKTAKKEPKLRLHAVLKEKKITKYRFAKLLYKPSSNVTVRFKDGYDPRFSTLASWVKVLGCQVINLIDE